MKVSVKLFAVAKELARGDELTIEVPQGATLGDLREALARQFPSLAPILAHAMWAVDTAYARDDVVLSENSEVAIIPPVSGG